MATALEDTVITIPPSGGICRVEMPASAGGAGREVYQVTPQTLGRMLTGLEGDGGDVRWVDLLGATTPGIALCQRRNGLYMILAFPSRIKHVRHNRANAAINGGLVPFNLPPTAWVLQFDATRENLQNSWIFSTVSRVTSVTDMTLTRHFPFGNSHPGGAVCWGNVTLTVLTSRDPVAADNLFF